MRDHARHETPASQAEAFSTKAMIAAIVAATAAGAILRFVRLDQLELWLDESCTWHFVREASAFDFHSEPLLYENASRLYYILLAGWTAVLGDTAWDLRSFSAAVGTLTIPLIAMWIRSECGTPAGALAAWLTALHPLHIHYSREARFYPLLALELIVLFWTARFAVRTDRRRYWAAYALMWLAVLWTHYYSLFLTPIALAMPLLAGTPTPMRWKRWLIAHAAVAAAFGPWFLYVVSPVSSRGNGDWIAAYFNGYPPWTAIPRTFAAFAPGGCYPGYTLELGVIGPQTMATACVGIGSAIAATAAFGFLSGSSAARPTTPTRAFFALAALLPLLISFAYSLVRSPIYVVARYDQVAWPAFMLILSAGMASLIRWAGPRRLVAAALVVLPLAASLHVTLSGLSVAAHTEPRRQSFIAMLRKLVAPGDRLVAWGTIPWEYRYYMAKQWPDRPPMHCFPASLYGQVGWYSPRRELDDLMGLRRDAERLASLHQSTMPPGSTIWILVDGDINPSLGRQDPGFQVDLMLVEALEKAGAVDRPTDPNLPLLAFRWPVAPTQTERPERRP